jgi:hypothetical protein
MSSGRSICFIEEIAMTDAATLTGLNLDYIHAAQNSDVNWFDGNLGSDFTCTPSDGSFLDRAAFLKQTAGQPRRSMLDVDQVQMRVLGDFAVIHARTAFKTPDGGIGFARYTDIWTRRDGRWVAISAQITRIT